MKASFLALTSLPDFGLEADDIQEAGPRSLIVRKWNWEYGLAHQFQKHCVKMLQEIPSLRVLICTSHPRVLTDGRGLQKPRKGEVLELKEFKADLYPHLPYPLHKIERGGGLTFHHPGQFVFYPIVKLNPKTLSLSKMTDNIFDSAIEVLKTWGIDNLSHTHKLFGIWSGDRKLASMGIAIEKLTTFHGMALNLVKDHEMAQALAMLNPCGLDPHTYIGVNELTALPEKAHDEFTNQFLKTILAKWL